MALSDNDLKNEFLMKEYESLRIEMNESVKETRTLERQAVIATGIVWSWLAVTENAPYKQIIWMPSVLVLLSVYRAHGLTLHIDKIAKYLAKIENAVVAFNEDMGFERHHSAVLTSKRLSAYFFWILLFFITIIIPVAFYNKR